MQKFIQGVLLVLSLLWATAANANNTPQEWALWRAEQHLDRLLTGTSPAPLFETLLLRKNLEDDCLLLGAVGLNETTYDTLLRDAYVFEIQMRLARLRTQAYKIAPDADLETIAKHLITSGLTHAEVGTSAVELRQMHIAMYLYYAGAIRDFVHAYKDAHPVFWEILRSFINAAGVSPREIGVDPVELARRTCGRECA